MLKLKILKAVVFIMTFLLIAGIAVLVFQLAGGLKRISAAPKETTVSLGEPQGARIEQTAAEGNNLYLLVKGGGRPDRIIIFDTETSRAASTININ